MIQIHYYWQKGLYIDTVTRIITWFWWKKSAFSIQCEYTVELFNFRISVVLYLPLALGVCIHRPVFWFEIRHHLAFPNRNQTSMLMSNGRCRKWYRKIYITLSLTLKTQWNVLVKSQCEPATALRGLGADVSVSAWSVHSYLLKQTRPPKSFITRLL